MRIGNVIVTLFIVLGLCFSVPYNGYLQLFHHCNDSNCSLGNFINEKKSEVCSHGSCLPHFLNDGYLFQLEKSFSDALPVEGSDDDEPCPYVSMANNKVLKI